MQNNSLSLIVPNYNYGIFISECLDSINDQTVMPDEIIVIDDCSTDESVEIIKNYKTQNFKFIQNDKNLGIVNNFSKAVEQASCELVTIVASDNTITPDFVEKFLEYSTQYPEYAIYYNDIILFGPLARGLAKRVGAKDIGHNKYLWEFPEATEKAIEGLKDTNFMNGTAMFRKTWYDKVGGFIESKTAEDFDLFRRMVYAGGKPKHVPYATLEYRQHSLDQANTAIELDIMNTELLERNAVLEAEIRRVDGILQVRDGEINELKLERDKLNQKIQDIEHSITWRIANKLKKILGKTP